MWYGTKWCHRRAYLFFFWPVAFGSTFVGTGMSSFYFVLVDDEVFLCFLLGLI